MKIKVFLFILTAFVIYGFSLVQEEDFVTDVVKKFVVRSRTQPQEKVYLHTDRENYDAGERIWFRAYLQDAMTHQPSIYSQYVYIELINRQDSVFQRVKLWHQDSVYSGYMDLPEGLPQGEYFLRGFSYWMQNKGEDYLFRKRFIISNSKENMIVYNITYEKNNEDYVARLRFTQRDGEPYKRITVFHAFGKDDQKEREKQIRTNDNGEIVLPFDANKGYTTLNLRFSENAPVLFKRTFAVPEYSEDYEIQFFPEGGDLIAGSIQKVAFKAIGKDGLAREVKGNIYNASGEVVMPIETTHKGMGIVSFMIMPGEKYHIVAKSAEGIEKKFDFPTVKTDKIALQVLARGNILNYSILAGNEAVVPNNLHLVAHVRGRILAVDPLEGRNRGVLSLEEYPEGILHLALMDDKNNIYSQRLYFVKNKNKASINVNTDKKGYANREEVKLNINAETNISGSFSLSVIPFNNEDTIRFSKNILSELLLTSDLKGYIEEPTYYFQEENSNMVDYNLDILMLTHGWTRFDVGKLLRGEAEEEGDFFLERGQAIVGKVLNVWGKDAKNAKLTLASVPIPKIMEATTTDEQGNFVVDGVGFVDGTKFIIQANNQRGGKNVEVQLIEDEFLPPHVIEPYGVRYKHEEDKFLEKFNLPYYIENGERVYVLEEFKVTADAEPLTGQDFYHYLSRNTLNAKDIAELGLPDIRLVLESLPGIFIEDLGEGEVVTRQGKPLLVVIDDIPEDDMIFLFMLQPSDIASISYMAPIEASTFFSGSRAGNGAIIVTLDKNYSRPRPSRPNIGEFAPFGYQKPEEFFMPAYQVDSVRMNEDYYDGRKTIYWNPNVKLEAGKSTPLSFYTADDNKYHKIVLEGILEDGTLYRREMDF